MNNKLLLSALFTSAILGLQPTAQAHGGTYRGPGDTVPPGGESGGSGGTTTPAPSGPNAPPLSGPSTGNPSSPTAPGAAPRGGSRGTSTPIGVSGADLTQWQFWWGFNKSPYLNLKNRIHSSGPQSGDDELFLGDGQNAQINGSQAPDAAQIRNEVVPALLQALAQERSNDILSSALIALAKIGDELDESGASPFVNVMTSFLDHSSQEVSETAAVSLGILADVRSIPTLVHLMKDETEGRKAVGSTEVPYRTRAFAAFGLGLIGHATFDNQRRQEIAAHLIDMLEAPRFSSRDLKVAAMTALGLIPLEWEGASQSVEGNEVVKGSSQWHAANRSRLIAYLIDYSDAKKLRAKKTTRHWFVIAHAPTALARLMDAGAAAEMKIQLADHLLEMIDKHSKLEQEIQQSATIALGMIGDADGDRVDVLIRSELIRMIKDGDQQSRRYALIALAQSGSRAGAGEDSLKGSNAVRKQLTKQMSRGKSTMKPWSALALGVFGRAVIDAGEATHDDTNLALRTACAKQKSPSNVGAYCLALGLRKDLDASSILLKKMHGFKGSLDTRGDAAIALGLLNDASTKADIRALVESSRYKPELLKSASIALGLMGDKSVVDLLVDMLKEAKGLSTQAAISSALGQIGDKRSVAPLLRLLKDAQHTDLARAFAAVALGIVCDKEPLPWNSKISSNINYRANTPTLTDSTGTGILDIL